MRNRRAITISSRVIEVHTRRRVLFLGTQPFWPANTGARLRNYYLARELSKRFDVTYLSFADQCAETSEANASVGEESNRIRTVTVLPPVRYGLRNVVLGAIGRKPITVLNYTSTEMAGRLELLLKESNFDVVQMESIHLVEYLPLIRAARSKPAVILDWHNIESELMRRYSALERNPARRVYACMTAAKIDRLERWALTQFDAHITVSNRERESLLSKMPGANVRVIENGVDVDAFSEEVDRAGRLPDERRGNLRRLVFVGSMDYLANEEAALRFAREVWPRIHAVHPDLVFTIVGRNPGPVVRALENIAGVEVTGTVEDVRPYYVESVAAVVPLNFGGGSRLKILEAMAAGVPVVSTTLGAEGLDVEDGYNLLLANKPDEFCAAVRTLCEINSTRSALTERARNLVAGKYSWRRLGDRLSELHLQLAQARSEQSKWSTARALAKPVSSGRAGLRAGASVSTLAAAPVKSGEI